MVSQLHHVAFRRMVEGQPEQHILCVLIPIRVIKLIKIIDQYSLVFDKCKRFCKIGWSLIDCEGAAIVQTRLGRPVIHRVKKPGVLRRPVKDATGRNAWIMMMPDIQTDGQRIDSPGVQYFSYMVH